jgi:hypothetical protein
MLSKLIIQQRNIKSVRKVLEKGKSKIASRAFRTFLKRAKILASRAWWKVLQKGQKAKNVASGACWNFP